MNEQAIQDAYNLFVSNGYKKSIDDFKALIASNPNALNDSYTLFTGSGYKKSIDDYKILMGITSAQPQPQAQPQVKKKEPTMASKSGATSSVSPKPIDQYSQRFTQPIAEFQQEPTAPPVVLTEEGKKTYVAPKPKPFDIELATKTLKKINEDRANEYRKDPSVVTREEKEKAIQEANDGILTREESLRNITSNAVNTIKMVVPKMNLVADQALEKLFGRELSSKLVGKNIYTGATMDEERAKALGEIGDLMSQMKETTGITESVKKLSRGENGSASDLIVAAANSLSQIGTTAINAFATRGLSLYTDAVGGALYDYNEEKAKQKGKTIEQLFQDEEADVAVPALFGGVSFYLDKIGLQGATNMIKKKLTGDFMKKAALFGFETNKEGITEWLQEGVDASNTALGKGGSAKDATQAAVDAMFSERGLETYLQGSVGSAALAGGARLISKDNHNNYSKLTEENVKLLGDLQSGNIDTDTKKMVLDVLADNKSKLDDILSFDRKVIDKLSEEDKSKVADLYVELNSKRKLKNNGNISEVLRTKVIEDVAKLETEISKIVNKVSPKNKVKAPIIKPALTPEETIRRDELQAAIDEEKNTTGIIIIGDESLTKEEAVNELQLLNKKEQDAIQEQTTNEGVLLTEQPQVGLQEVGKGDQVTEVVTEEAKPKEEVALSDVKNTSEFIASNNLSSEIMQNSEYIFSVNPENKIEDLLSERYHQAKLDGSNPDLVKAVEDAVGRTIQEQQAVTETVAPTEEEVTDESLVEYNPSEEIKDKDMGLLLKTLKSKKINPQAEPIITDLGDTVVFEYRTNLEDGESVDRITFERKSDGSLSNKNVLVQKNYVPIRNTIGFNNYIQEKRNQLKETTTQNQTNEQATTEQPKKPSAGNRLFNQPIEAIKEIANRYYERAFGITRPDFKGTRELDKVRAKRISDAFAAMKHSPNDPKVREAYNALAKETLDQYKAFLDAGYVVEINNEEPYANSQEMIDDLRNNKRIKIFSTESGFGDNPITDKQRRENPLLATSEFKDTNGNTLLVNDLFRAVHDFFGHAELGNSFGPLGEENAWNVHARMFSPLARRAMTTETRGQNSYVNFSGVNEETDKLREEARKLREEGKYQEALEKTDEIYEKISFADQKVGLLPEEFSKIDEEVTAEQEVADLETLLRENRFSNGYNEKYKKNAAQIENQRRLADLARKALAKIAPNVKIILHETTDSYDNAVPKRSQGAFITKTNTIHINLQYADVETIPHEVFHAILFIKIKTDPRATKVTKEMFESVKKVLDKDSPIYKQIEEVASTYDKTLKDEERLAELFGILSVNYEKLPVPAKSAIVRFIEKIAKLFGLDATKLIGRTDNSVINLLNTLSEKVAKGQEIQESEIDILGVGGDGKRTTLFRQADANNINNIIKLARANGFSESAISTVLNNRGFSEQEITDALATELGAKSKVEVTEELLPGKEELLKKVDALIKRQQSKDVTKGKIAENVKKLMEKSDAYNNATDIQKEKLIRDANKKIGIREKNAPSVKALKQGVVTETERGVSAFDRFFGAIEPEKKITMTEKQAFAEQMKSENRGGKDAKKLFMKLSTELTKSIKELADSGKITVKQAAAVLRKFSGVNVFDDASIDRFVEYMSKVFENAEYAEKISNAFAKLPTAKRNAKTKLGIAESLMPSLNRMLSIKPTLIPDAVLDSYLDIIDMIGIKSEVLTLEEINSLTKRVDEILDAVNTEVSLADELAERFNDYQDKVLDEDGKLDYAATIKAMLKDNTISEDEAEIMRKYKSSIVEPIERVKKTEAELAVEKEQLIKAVESLDVDAENLPTRDERELATELAKLIKTDAIKELTNNQLKNLFKTIDNINNGYLPHYAQLMTERLNAINNAKQLANGVQKASLLPFSKLYANLKAAILNIGKKRTSGVLEMIRRNPLFDIDAVLGNSKNKPVFNAMFEKSAEAEQKYKSAVSKVLRKLTEAQQKVSQSFGNDGNKTLLSSFKMMTYMVQLEHDSNIGSKQVNQAADYLKATIKHIDDGKSEFGERDATMLQSILDDYTNAEGQIDIDKLYKSFNNAEKDAIKTVREINESLTDKAVYTASIIRGDKINPLNNYVHLNVLTDTSPTDNLAGVSSMEQYNQSIMPSSKAKSLIERTGKVSPLNFDVFTSAMRGANFILMDYNLTEPIRTARKTINETKALMEKDGRMPKKDRDLLNAISNAYEEVVSNILTNNFIDSSVAEEALNFLTKQGYRAILASAPRFVAELSSNVSYALIAEPKAFAVGVGLRNFILSPSSVDVMNNLGSKETTRVYPEGTLSGRLVDTSLINQVSGIKGGKSKSDVENKARQIYNNSLKKYKNFVELTADALISTPDKMVMRPIWFGSFVNEFENITGKKPNLDKIAANDEAYMNENKEALDKARDVADEKAVRAGATDNAFMGILKGTVKPNQNGWVRAFNTFNSFMTKFMMYEYVTARTGINAAMGNGSISRKQGAALIAGVTSRMLVYGIMVQTLGSLMTSLVLGDDDEEDDKTFLQKVGQYTTSTITGLIFGRDFGNATRSVVNFGLEKMNEKYLDALREGEYDPYQDAIQYSILPNDPKKTNTDLGDIIMKLGGSTGPAMKTANLIIKKATEEPKKEAEAIERSDREIYQRIPLEVLGNAGFIPLYKDVRKILMADMYKSLRQSKGPTKKDAEKELLQGYDNRTDMKRYEPELYEQTFGKGSPTYEIDKMMKDMEKQEKEMEQQMKDAMYGYTGETKKKTKKKK
jgi:hypothetical protein